MHEHTDGFIKKLFQGRIHTALLFPYPAMDSEEEETVNALIESLDKFASGHIDAARIDREGRIPEDVLKGIADLGLFGLTIPEEYGGYGFGSTAYARVISALARHCASTAATVGAHQSIGYKALLLAGSEEQKRRYLPRLASGEILAAFALTEPCAGSDVQSMKTTAVPTDNGSSWLLNGEKLWITNGGIADFFTVFAKTPVRVNGMPQARITAFIVTGDMKGLQRGKEEEKMGIKGSSTTEIFFDNVIVPRENRIGEEGSGFNLAMEVLNNGRLTLAAGCIDVSRRLMHLSAEYADRREAFGHRIGEYELIKNKIGRMAVNIFAMESMVYLTTGIVDRGTRDYSVESALCKVFATETLWNIANDALQISGGNGYMKEYPYERIVRDCRINMIFEGTNEILRLYAGGVCLARYGKALAGAAAGLGSMLKFAVGDFVREWTAPALPVDSALENEAAEVRRLVPLLSRVARRSLRTWRRAIIDHEMIVARLAEDAMDLYAMLACVSRTQALLTAGNAAEREIELTRTFCRSASRRVLRRLEDDRDGQDTSCNRIAESVFGRVRS